jgi:hypothetical protein
LLARLISLFILTLGGNGCAGISGFFFMTIQLENNMGSYPNLVIKKKPEIPAEPFPPTIIILILIFVAAGNAIERDTV